MLFTQKIHVKNYVKLAKIAQPQTKPGRRWVDIHPQTDMGLAHVHEPAQTDQIKHF
jgi:hypothetical protein